MGMVYKFLRGDRMKGSPTQHIPTLDMQAFRELLTGKARPRP
jgi:hypothetical protein